ncbi:hypothetical protein AA0113_g11245 [Alternaria arborescens]|jgi:hypothetical protein|uniref:Uncharacterized protein n=1 Tax=Alternaria arborescens TaxID=156630 RepID=A0A4V1WZ86_9PLEO|nr:hypothetical protein AA0111_g9671 [Alternaria arborescens]RYN19987.1 hypothetical protein AA0112_g10886 [Alternaria arborescens]RYO21176.1 hypothetical protein AA0111_g9671 [Alternaria arborescens]RYO39044.1 hypothetical protein AA0113_g11245 [Alternaria arborescens]
MEKTLREWFQKLGPEIDVLIEERRSQKPMFEPETEDSADELDQSIH